MDDAARLGHGGMHAAMDRPGGEVRRIRAVHGRLVVGIEQQQFRGLDAREMPPARVHQELLAVGRYGQAEVIGHRLVPVKLDGQPKCRRKVDTQLPFVGFKSPSGLECGEVAHHNLLCTRADRIAQFGLVRQLRLMAAGRVDGSGVGE